MVRLSFLFILSCLCCLSCLEDSITDTTTTTGNVIPTTRFVHNISGFVLDQEGIAISGAAVSIGDQIVISDVDGQFELQSISINEDGVFVAASQLGYIDAGSRIYQNSSLKADITIVLKEQPAISSSFNSSVGGQIISEDGLILNFASNSITYEAQPYNGEVYVSILYQDLTTLPIEQYTLRSNLILNQGEAFKQILNSAVAIEVSLSDAQGRKLNVAEESVVSASIPLPLSINNNENLQLYSFNLSSGLLEDGQEINIIDQFAHVEIPHFSWWVLGLPTEAVDICLDFTGINGVAPTDDLFTIRNESGLYLLYGELEYNTELCVPAPANDNLLLQVYSYCLREKANETLTTSSTPVTNIELEVNQESNSYTLSGAFFDCNNDPLSEVVDVSILGPYRFNTSQSFTSSYNLEFDECIETDRSRIVFFESKNKILHEFDLSELTPGINTANIVLCEDNAAESFVEINGIAFSGCIARLNKEETLLSLEDESNLFVMGFDGFGTGEFDCRIILNTESYEGIVTVTSYGDIDKTIEGTLTVASIQDPTTEVKGSFVAKRIK